MTQTNMADKSKRKPNRIPVHFADGEEQKERDSELSDAKDESGLSPEEIGRESAYDDETDVARQINRGDEQDTQAGRERADEQWPEA